MTVAIHQPNYLPWLGYFYKLLKADVFVFHDGVPFSRSSYTRRCRIPAARGSEEQEWLSVPVQHAPEGTPIVNIKLDHSRDWYVKHLNKIRNTYASAGFYEEVFPLFKRSIDDVRKETDLTLLNIALIQRICIELEIEVKCVRSHEYGIQETGSALNLALAQTLGASTYLSGTGALEYEESVQFAKNNIAIAVADVKGWLEMNPYEQDSPVFNGGLSIVDALMNLGTGGTRNLLDKMVRELQPLS